MVYDYFSFSTVTKALGESGLSVFNTVSKANHSAIKTFKGGRPKLDSWDPQKGLSVLHRKLPCDLQSTSYPES